MLAEPETFAHVAERLRTARIGAGFKSASAFARYAGVNITTYICHETGRRSLLPVPERRYCERLGLRPGALLYGRGLEITRRAVFRRSGIEQQTARRPSAEFVQVIDRWPCRQYLADDLGVSYHTVASWIRRRFLPVHWWIAVAQAAARRDINDVTYDELAEIYRRADSL